MISLPDALNFYVSPDTKVLSHFVPLLVSCRSEHLVNSCVLCSPVAQMVQLVSNSSLSLVLIKHRDISVISKHGYLTVNRRTGIMIDLGVAVFVQIVWFALLSLRFALERLHWMLLLLLLLTHLLQSQLTLVLLLVQLYCKSVHFLLRFSSSRSTSAV